MDTGDIVKSWNLSGHIHTEEELLKELAQKILTLWNDNPSKLMNTLYRLDVSEDKVKNALQSSKENSFAYELATLIINREKQKAILRKKYNSN